MKHVYIITGIVATIYFIVIGIFSTILGSEGMIGDFHNKIQKCLVHTSVSLDR